MDSTEENSTLNGYGLVTCIVLSINMNPVLREWKTLKAQTAIVLALSQLDRMCDVQDKSLETVMP